MHILLKYDNLYVITVWQFPVFVENTLTSNVTCWILEDYRDMIKSYTNKHESEVEVFCYVLLEKIRNVHINLYIKVHHCIVEHLQITFMMR